MSNHVGRIRSFKVETTLGIYHAINLKKNLILMTGSFSLVIVLFFIFSACLDIVNKLLPSQSSFTPDIVIASQDYSNSIDKSVEEEIACYSGVESTFGLMMSVAFPVQVNGKEATIDLYSYDNDMFKRSKKSIISGDFSKVYGNSDYALVVFNQDSHLNVGDKIKVGNNEIEIACVSSDGIGSISGTSTVVVSEETYARIIGENKYAMLGAVFDNNMSEEDFKQIKALAGNNVFRDRDNIGAPEVLLFAVPEDLYLLLSKAIYVGMEIVPVPRNSSYSTNPGETLVESEFLKNFILAKTVQIPDENVEG